MLNIVIERYSKSYNFKANPNKPGSFQNNWKNNSLDWFVLYDDNAELFRAHCQSVANYNFGEQQSLGSEYGDTVREGPFKMKCFVEPRAFHGEIHGICETTDMDGEIINHESMQKSGDYQLGRWLVHDRWSNKIHGDTNYAWSAGCFILSSGDLKALNVVLKSCGVKPGNIIPGNVIVIN